jgi:hypothetical protein
MPWGVAAAILLLGANGSCGRKEPARRVPAADGTGTVAAGVGTADGGTPPTAVDRTADCIHGPLDGPSRPLPPDVLVESLYLDREGTVEAGFRVYVDGRMEAKSIDGDWTAGTTLTAEKLGTVRTAVTAARLGAAAGAYRTAQPGKDMGGSELRVRDGSDLVTVAADDPCFVPQTHQLLAALVEVFD